MKNFGEHHVYKAAQICSSNSAKLPLPQSEQANADTFVAFKGKVLTLRLKNLDLFSIHMIKPFKRTYQPGLRRAKLFRSRWYQPQL